MNMESTAQPQRKVRTAGGRVYLVLEESAHYFIGQNNNMVYAVPKHTVTEVPATEGA